MRKRGWAVARVALLGIGAGLGWACAPAPAAAQTVDSVAIKIRERLGRLGRPPAPDTATLPDSLTDTEIRVAQRRGSPAPATSTDSLIVRLLGLPGYDATQYRGTAADFDAESQVLVLRGDSASRASVVLRGTTLTADSLIRYEQAQGRVRAEGNPVFKAPDRDPVESQRVIYDLEAERGTAFGARTRYSEGATWFVTGDLPSVTPGVVYGEHTDFTSCELLVPHYHFRADHIKIVAGRILVARPVKLYFADVPVAWLPFIAQSLGTGRASGLLTPRFSINDIVRTSTGYNRRVSNVGFYWAVSDYADATVAMDWFSGNFTSLTGSVRYGWARQFLNGSINFREYWKEEGGTTLSFDTGHDWQIDERTRLNARASYVSDGDFVRRNSYDPYELTQSINSSGGLDRRFDWGNTSISGLRDQFLNTGRVTMTLPQVQLNLSPITLLRAPALRARWFNNLTWSGNLGARREIMDEADTLMGTAQILTPDQNKLAGNVSSRFGLGNLSWQQSLSVDKPTVLQVALPGAAAAVLAVSPSGRPLVGSAAAANAVTLTDIGQTNLNWNTSLGYQQTLIGSTTITPNLTLSGQARRSDTSLVAPDRFVSAPRRLAFGASLKSDLFGFFPGFGPFEAIRHKVSPGIDFSYAPEVTTSSPLQQAFFGRTAIQPRKEITLSFNQTFEAKRKAAPGDSARAAAAGPRVGAPAFGAPAFGAPGLGAPADTTRGLSAAGGLSGAGLRRAERANIVTLLALRTTAVQYDFVEADTAGSFLWGFRTTRIDNQISSDYLQGLQVSMGHELFLDTAVALPTGGERRERRFDLQLSDLNLGFALSNRSAIFRGLGLFGAAPDSAAAPPETAANTPPTRTPENPFVQTTAATDEASIIPRSDQRAGDPRAGPRSTEVGSWNASFTYSLVRHRSALQTGSQVLGANFTLKPTALWDLSWRTSYDIEQGAFNDHVIGLTRDIHDWEARFDFIKTATGNWSFRFDVALKANRDFKFDYQQRNTDVAPGR